MRLLPLRISHRWLLLYDGLAVIMTIFDAFGLLYFSWVPDNEKHSFKEVVCLLYEKYNLNGKAVNIVRSFHLKFKAEKLTKNGKECKESLTSKGFYNKS